MEGRLVPGESQQQESQAVADSADEWRRNADWDRVLKGRIAFGIAALAVWAIGSALGCVCAAPAAIAQTSPSPAFTLGLAHAGYTPSLTSSKPIFILVVGSGARPPQPYDRGLADSIHIVGINLAKHRVTILGVPRDSWVSIPGHGTNKINASMADGGPQLLIQTLEQITRIRLDYYIVTSFEGVTSAYDMIGGLTLDVPFPMHDSYSKADFGAGIQHLTGKQVLAFARDRHSLVSGDLGRSEDTGRALIASLIQLRRQFAKDPSVLFDYVGALLQNVKTTLSLPQVLDFAFTALSIDPAHTANYVLPGTIGSVGGLSIVNLAPGDGAIYRDFAPDAIISKKNAPPSPNAHQPGCCK